MAANAHSRTYCTEPECDKPQRSLGLCEKHYSRLRRHGSAATRLRRANGEGGFSPAGYFRTHADGRRIREHILVAERTLGKPLPPGAVVHHVNENRADNRPENLVICQDQGYHNILHGRIAARKATGNPNAKPCRYCHEHDEPSNLVKNGTSHYHKACAALDQRERRRRRKEDYLGCRDVEDRLGLAAQ